MKRIEGLLFPASSLAGTKDTELAQFPSPLEDEALCFFKGFAPKLAGDSEPDEKRKLREAIQEHVTEDPGLVAQRKIKECWAKGDIAGAEEVLAKFKREHPGDSSSVVIGKRKRKDWHSSETVITFRVDPMDRTDW